jgi:hypothetical protein
MLQSNNIGMIEIFHDLKLSIFVPLVLVNFLDSNNLSCLSDTCLKNYPE